MTEERKTPLLDELEKGPWPSFVTEIKLAAEDNESCAGLLGQVRGGTQRAGRGGSER